MKRAHALVISVLACLGIALAAVPAHRAALASNPPMPPNPSSTYQPNPNQTFGPSNPSSSGGASIPVPPGVPMPQSQIVLPAGATPVQFIMQQLPPGGVALTSIASYPLFDPTAASYGWWDDKSPEAASAASQLDHRQIVGAAFADYLATVYILERAPIDPPVTLARGFIFRHGTKLYGALGPSYSLNAAADLTAKSVGKWAIVLRDANGQQLARYAFTPRLRDIVAFAYRVVDNAEASTLELVGPSGVADAKNLSEAPPTLRIVWPQDGGVVRGMAGTVHVSWLAQAETGKRILASVFYSADGGKHFKPEAFEKQLSALDIRINPNASDHIVKVVVTDGSRSSVAQSTFSLSS